MVVGVRRQTVREIDASAVKKRAAGRERDQHRRVSVLGDTDRDM